MILRVWLVVAMTVPALYELEAQLVAPEPLVLQVDDTLGLGDAFLTELRTAALQDAHAPVYLANHAYVRIVERGSVSDQPPGHRVPLPRPNPVAETWTPTPDRVDNLRIRVLGSEPLDAMWRISARNGSQAPQFPPGASCTVEPNRQGAAAATDVPTPGVNLSRPMLHLGCDVDSFTWDHKGHLVIWNTTVRLTYRGPGGEEESHDVRAGRHERTDLLGGREFIDRFLFVEPLFDAGRLTWTPPPSVGVHLYAPALVFQGRVAIPASAGWYAWGPVGDPNLVPALTPGGTFDMRPWGTDGLHVKGLTPEAPTVARDPSPLDPSLAVALVAAAAAVWRFRRLLRRGLGAGLAFFTRLKTHALLRHERRRLILDLVTHEPGIGLKELARAAQLTPRAVEYHVDVLARHDLLRIHRFGHRTALFLPQQVSPDRAAQLRLLRQPRFREVLAMLNGPLRTQKQIAQELGCDQSYVSQLLAQLHEAGLVRRERQGRRVLYSPLASASPT